MPEKYVKLHIGLTRAMQSRLEAGGAAAVKKLAGEIGLTGVTSERLKRFGILSGEADADHVKEIEGHEGVEFVEADQKRRAM